jgi:hypothetical protein
MFGGAMVTAILAARSRLAASSSARGRNLILAGVEQHAVEDLEPDLVGETRRETSAECLVAQMLLHGAQDVASQRMARRRIQIGLATGDREVDPPLRPEAGLHVLRSAQRGRTKSDCAGRAGKKFATVYWHADPPTPRSRHVGAHVTL